MHSQKRILTAAVAAALFAIGASAAQADEYTTLDTIKVTASRVEQELMDVNMSVSVITQEEIAQSEARTVGDLLQDVPGVRINNDGSQGMKRIMIRGEDTFRTLVMIDGQKMSEHKSMSGSPMLIDPAMIERIEVIKGPASVLYGSDAIGGAINIITKKGGSKPFEASVSAGMDNLSNGKTASAMIAGAKDGWHYRLGLAHESGDDMRTPAGKLPYNDFSSFGANGYLAYDIDANKTIGMTVDHFDLDFKSGAVPYGDKFLVDVPQWKRDKVGLFADLKSLNQNLHRVRLDVFYQKSNKQMENYMNGIGGMPMILDIFADNDLDQYGFSVQTDWQLGGDNYLIVGYEYNRDELDATSNTYSTMSMVGPGYYYTNFGTYEGTFQTHSAFASMDTILPHDFTLTYGARYTYVQTDMDKSYSLKHYYQGQNTGKDVITSTPGQKNDDRVVFNAGVTWTGIDDLTLRALWSQGFRAPLLQERYIPTAMGQMATLTYGNPDLDPETSNNFEIGARFLKGGLSIDSAVFLSLADNYIAALPFDNAGNRRYENIAQAKTFGVELTAAYEIGSTGFEPYANVTWMRRQYDNGEGFKTYDSATPEVVARYGVRWTAEYNGLGLRTDVFARSQTATKYDDGVADTTKTSSYHLGGATTLNLTAGVSFGPEKQYSLDAGFYNIFDKKYQDNTATYEPGRYFSIKMNARF